MSARIYLLPDQVKNEEEEEEDGDFAGGMLMNSIELKAVKPFPGDQGLERISPGQRGGGHPRGPQPLL